MVKALGLLFNHTYGLLSACCEFFFEEGEFLVHTHRTFWIILNLGRREVVPNCHLSGYETRYSRQPAQTSMLLWTRSSRKKVCIGYWIVWPHLYSKFRLYKMMVVQEYFFSDFQNCSTYCQTHSGKCCCITGEWLTSVNFMRGLYI